MHSAVQSPDAARPTADARSWSWLRLALWPGWPWAAGLVAIVSIPMLDGLFSGVVAYERDTSVFYYPLMAWASQRLHQGELPLWTPQVFGGYPIFADGEVGLAYPPALLAMVMLSADAALIGLRLVHLWIAALGMFALARAWRLPYSSGVLAGLVFALGSFLAAQIHHENIVRTAAWLPLLLAVVERALGSPAHRVRWTLVAALVLGLAGVSLHSQMVFIDLLILLLYGAYRWAIGPLTPCGLKYAWLDRLASVALVCAPVVLLGLGLAAVQLVPLLELAGFSARGSGIPYSESAAYSLTPYGLVQLLFPYVFRGPGNQQWGLWTHWESYLYVGLVPLVLASMALACVRRREVVGWGLVGLLGLVLGLGQYSPINLHYLLWLLPGLSGLRAPGRFATVVIIALAMLSAYGLAWLQSAGTERYRVRKVLGAWWAALAAIVVGGGVLHLALLLWPAPAMRAIDFGYLSLSRDSYPLTAEAVLTGLRWATDLVNPNVWGQIVILVVALVALGAAFGRRGSEPAGLWPVVLVGMAAVDLLAYGWVIHPREPLSRLAAEPPAVRAVEQIPSSDAAPNRVLASPVLNQVAVDRLAPFGVEEANGYSSLQFIWHRDYLGRALYADDALLDLWNVRFVLDPAQYGQLSSYRDVNFLSSQALLHAPAGSKLSEQIFALDPSKPVTELRFVTALMGAVDVPQGAPVAVAELLDASGNGVASAELLAGRDVMEWAWDLPTVQSVVKHQRIEVAGVATERGTDGKAAAGDRLLSYAGFTYDRPVTASYVVVRAIPPVGELALYGAAVVASDGSVQQLFGRTKTKYRPVYVDNQIRVWENTSAQPRAFVVPAVRTAPNLGAALSEMIHRPFQPDREAILSFDSSAATANLATRGGGTGSARVSAYLADAVEVHTSASADAWLVLSDTYYPGWSATVDGQPTPLLRGDVLFRVVPIPAGDHIVTFQFDPTSIKLGLAISAGTLLLVLGGLLFPGRLKRPTRTT